MAFMEENLPPGFRFHPTDEELITHYLNNKIADRGFTSKAIAVVDLNKCEPWDLPALATMGEKEWYFFNLKDRKYPTGLRTNRATQAGYWKTTGKDKEIFRGGVLVGMKKTLVFYRGRAPKGEKSNWVMHEYRPEGKLSFKSSKDEWVVCRVFKKSSSAAKKPPQSPSSSQQYTYHEDPPPTRTDPITNEYGEIIEIPNNSNAGNDDLGNSGISSQPSNRYYNGSNNADQVLNRSESQNHYNSMSMNNLAGMNNLADMNWGNNNNMSLPWNGASCGSSGLLNTSNMTLDSLLLKALQLRSFQPRNAGSTLPALMTPHDYRLTFNNLSQQQAAENSNLVPPLGTDYSSSMLATSSSSSLQQQAQEQVQDQAFSMDSIW